MDLAGEGKQRMATTDDATRIALALPGTVQSSHFDSIDFRVRKKIFASFPKPDQMTVRLEPEHARALIETDPETYIPHAGVWGTRGRIRIVLSRITIEDLEDLVYDSWFRIAPTSLQSESYD